MESEQPFEGDNRLLLGIFLSVITFWLFAQSLVNIVPALESSFSTSYGTINVAVSLTALLCGLFVVGSGGLADRYGRVKMTYIGLTLSVSGHYLLSSRDLSLYLYLGEQYRDYLRHVSCLQH